MRARNGSVGETEASAEWMHGNCAAPEERCTWHQDCGIPSLLQ
ncbi:hypothetical protein SAMN06265222_10972 [Neorhodopirellula lusitana]|uniref:Uncharacterized protein n=1 Tax=Neorhodopirellula lusitana TaxID=445327 RepID=A0ABY1QAC9_9BACT|nr:hypothetical protein [Neorhodopirellula lusitana]SMP65517.1 hypothetical protein SAMN06265222_10972 [Neorhodopirellula lusitana]